MDPLPDFLSHVEYGAIRLTGTRIGLEHVIRYFNEGDSPEVIARKLPSLTLAQVYKAIGHYLDNRAAVDEYVRGIDEIADRLEATSRRPDWEAMRRRFEAMKAAGKLPTGSP